MKRQVKLTVGAAGALLGVMLLGATPISERMGADEMFISGADYNAVLQERTGYAFTLGHYVGKYQALKDDMAWWQGMVAELSGTAAPGGMAAQLHGTTQERLGYQVATGHLAGVRRGMGQTILGYETVLADQIDQNKALRQRVLGLEYMLTLRTGGEAS